MSKKSLSKAISRKTVASENKNGSVNNPEIKEDIDYSLNDVALRGWVTTLATERELPSGDVVVQFRIAITRPEGGVDTIDLESWSAKSRRTALSLKDGEWIEVQGAIRRRFWKSGQGLASRWQVVTHEIKRL
jgi:single-strand DNA-binding protein